MDAEIVSRQLYELLKGGKGAPDYERAGRLHILTSVPVNSTVD
jgi:hypothetical protein